MDVVLYTEDLEPITIIDLPLWGLECAIKYGHFVIPVPSCVEKYDITPAVCMEQHKTVTVWVERFERKSRRSYFVFTKDEENALQLKAAFLPGQHKGVQEEYHRGFARGFITAIEKLLGE